MATTKSIYKGGLIIDTVHELSNTKLVTDAPCDNCGTGSSYSPTDLLATSLGSCMLTTIGIKAKDHDVDIDGTTYTTTKIMSNDAPRRVVEIITEITFPRNYTKEQLEFINLCIKTCPVASSVHPDIKQTTITHFPK